MKNKEIKGLTNVLSIEGNKIIKNSMKISDYFLDRDNEINFYEQIEKIKNDSIIIPFEWSFNQDKTFTSKTHYFENAKTFNELEITADLMPEIINLIHKFHELDIQVKLFEPAELLEKFKVKVKQPLFNISFADQKVKEIIKDYYLDNMNIVISHNDLSKGNFLNFDESWHLIDFEFVSMNHELFDYASFMSESLRPDQYIIFLNKLRLNSLQEKKLFDIITYQNYLWSYWASYMFEQTQDEIYYNIAQDKFEKLKLM